MKTVYLVTAGDGSDGNEWRVETIQSTREAAEAWIAAHNAHRPRWAELTPDNIEEWGVEHPFDPKDYPHDPPK